MTIDDYRRAIALNDLAHRKTLHERVLSENKPVDQIVHEVGEEAKLWLKELDFIHRPNTTNQQTA